MNDTIYRIYVDNKYVDYFTGLNRAKITAKMYLNLGHTVRILEDNLSGTGSLEEIKGA